MVGHPQKPHRQGERGADIFSGKEWSISTGLWAVLRLISGMITVAIPNYLALSTHSTQEQMFYVTQSSQQLYKEAALFSPLYK